MSDKLTLSRQIMDCREASAIIQRCSVAAGVNGWTQAEIERVLAGLQAAGATLQWLEKHEDKIKGMLGK